MVLLAVIEQGEGTTTSTSIVLWIVAGLVVILGMQRLPLVPDRLWRFICWAMAIVLGFYAAARIEVIPSGRIWITWPLLLIVALALAFRVEKLQERREIETAKDQWRSADRPVPALPS